MPKIALPKEVRCIRRFMIPLGETGITYQEFKHGQIVSDTMLIQKMYESYDGVSDQDCPFVPSTDHVTTICPKCNTKFDSSENRTDALQVQTKVGVNYEHMYFQFEQGSLVHHPWLMDAVIATGEPFDYVKANRCPKCDYVYF